MHIEPNPRRRRQSAADALKPAGRSPQRTDLDALSSAFGQIMGTTAQDQRQSLEQLMQGLDGASQELLQAPSEAALTRYGDAVRAFMRKAQQQAFSVDKHFDRHNRLYTLVREADSQLAQLTDALLAGQGKTIEMAARIREIRGLLLDMYI